VFSGISDHFTVVQALIFKLTALEIKVTLFLSVCLQFNDTCILKKQTNQCMLLTHTTIHFCFA